LKVTVWCAISVAGVIGLYFSEDKHGLTITVMATWYRHMLETVLQPEIERLNHAMRFQQDGATSHTARMCMEKLHEMFLHHLISQFGDLNWLSRSPDLSALTIFCGII
jgi:hypothetical protein